MTESRNFADLVIREMVALRGVSIRDTELYEKTLDDVWRDVTGPLLEEYCNCYSYGFTPLTTAVHLEEKLRDKK